MLIGCAGVLYEAINMAIYDVLHFVGLILKKEIENSCSSLSLIKTCEKFGENQFSI